MTSESERLSHQQEIMRVLEFNYRDLEANREGRITAQQGKEIWKREARLIEPFLIKFFLFVTPFFACIFFGAYIEAIAHPNLNSLIIFCFVLLTIVLVFGWPFARWNLRRDIAEREVLQIQGKVSIHLQGISYLQINKMHFYLRAAILERLKDGDPYVVYYLPRSKAIVSVEVME